MDPEISRQQMDIHEKAVVKSPSEMELLAVRIKNGLDAFNERKAELIILRDEVDGLDITSIEDKAGIKQVTEGRKKLKSARVEIEKEGKSMRDPLTALAKNISAKENELVALIEPTEKKLIEKERWVKSENERIAEEERQKEAKRVQDRIDRLAVYGYSIDITFLTAIDDSQFEKVVENAKVEFEKEESIKKQREEQERRQKEQDEKDREEIRRLKAKQEEADRLLREREEEIARKEKELKDKEDEAIRAKNKAEKEREDQERERAVAEEKAKLHNRLRQLTDLKLKFNFDTNQYEGYDCAVHYFDITGYDDEKWDAMILKMGPHIEAYKKEEENRAEEKRQAELKEAREKALIEQRERDEEAARQEAERLSQASDKDKFSALIEHLEEMPAIEPKSAKHKKLYAEVKELNAKVIAHINAKM